MPFPQCWTRRKHTPAATVPRTRERENGHHVWKQTSKIKKRKTTQNRKGKRRNIIWYYRCRCLNRARSKSSLVVPPPLHCKAHPPRPSHPLHQMGKHTPTSNTHQCNVWYLKMGSNPSHVFHFSLSLFLLLFSLLSLSFSLFLLSVPSSLFFSFHFRRN